MSPSIILYDRNGAGQAQAVLSQGGNEKVIAEAPSITQLKAGLGAVKQSHGVRNAPVEIRKGLAYQSTAISALPQFSVNDRFAMMAEIVDEVVDGELNAAVIVGRGGTGKSHTVYERIEAAGYDRVDLDIQPPVAVDEEDDASDITPADDALEFVKEYVLIKGGLSATELFKVLYSNRNRLVVFDDADSALEDEIRANILKAVLDTYDVREVTWLSPFLKNQGYPSSFIFNGKIIFISNKKMAEVPQAIRSRSMLLDLDMTNAELVDRVRAIADILLPNLDPEARTQLIDFIDTYRDSLKDLTIRTFQTAAPLMKRANWRNLILYSA